MIGTNKTIVSYLDSNGNGSYSGPGVDSVSFQHVEQRYNHSTNIDDDNDDDDDGDGDVVFDEEDMNEITKESKKLSTISMTTSKEFGTGAIGTSSIQLTLQEFMEINQRLSSSSSSSPQKQMKKCECGCYRSRIKSCPKIYDIQDAIQSSNVFITKEIRDYMDFELQIKKRQSQQECQVKEQVEEVDGVDTNTKNLDHTESGGYCLHKKSSYRGKHVIKYPFSNREVPLPQGHVNAPQYLVKALQEFIEKEQQNQLEEVQVGHSSNASTTAISPITNTKTISISDFGAGIGQYGSSLESLFPDTLLYKGYDGAGDVEDYTYGYLKFFDLTIPLNLPITDWILCLEVGEHIPHTSEGMVIRNLHAHNCKGIIISWGVEGQGGENHVNLHNNQYLIDIFQELGYVYDEDKTNGLRSAIPDGKVNGFWFRDSLMVIRRKDPVC